MADRCLKDGSSDRCTLMIFVWLAGKHDLTFLRTRGIYGYTLLFRYAEVIFKCASLLNKSMSTMSTNQMSLTTKFTHGLTKCA